MPLSPADLEGVTSFFPRTFWEPVGYRMALDFTRRPTPFRPQSCTTLVAHYGGAVNLPDGDTLTQPERQIDIKPLLAAITRDYLTNRTGGGYTRKSDGKYFPGYPIGYSFAFDTWGGVWELRGNDFLPAATNDHNGYTSAFLFITDGAAPASPAAWKAARAVGRLIRELHNTATGAPPTLFRDQFTDHGSLYIDTGQGTPTACAGSGIRAQIHTPIANLNSDTQPPKPPKPKEIPLRILILKDAGDAAILLSGFVATWLDPARYAAYHSVYQITDEPAAVSWLANTVFTGPLPPGVSKANVWQWQPTP